MALPLVERERLLKGNWKIRAEAGKVFNRAHARVIDTLPAGWRFMVRQWDKAASKDSDGGDWTVGLKMAYYPNGTYVIVDVQRFRLLPGSRDELIKNIASQDGRGTIISLFQDPAQAGKTDLHSTVTMLAGYDARGRIASGDKVTMANPLAAQWEVGNVALLRAEWNEALLQEYHAFPTKNVPDDQVDAGSGAFNTIRELVDAVPFTTSRRS